MKLKKKIIRQSYDYKAEADYYRAAKECPNCGNKEEFGSSADLIKATANNQVTIFEHLMYDGDRSYECKKCGCIWEVKQYKA